MNTKGTLAAVNKLMDGLSQAEKIDIANNILLNSDAFGVCFWDRSDIDIALKNVALDDNLGDVTLTEAEYCQIVANCRETYRKTDTVDIEEEISTVLSLRESAPATAE